MYVFSKIVSNYLIITGTVCIRAIILKILCTCICNKKYTQYELPELLLSGERRGEEGGGGGGGLNFIPKKSQIPTLKFVSKAFINLCTAHVTSTKLFSLSNNMILTCGKKEHRAYM